MVFGRLRLALVGLGVLGLIAAAAPVVALADHCGADGLVTPASGPVGTVFVIEPQLGSPTDLRLYRNDQLVRRIYLPDGTPYAFETKPGDAGRWEARAHLRSQPECRSVIPFTVTPLPDTAAASDTTHRVAVDQLVAVASLAGAAAAAWLLRRRAVLP